MDLPDEIWRMIFELLDVLEMVKLREVSKRFRFLIDTMCFKKLIIFDYCGIYLCYFPYRHRNFSGPILQFPKFNFHPDSSFQLVFANLKILLMGCDLGVDFNLELLNEFRRLEKLYLRRIELPERTHVLKLPNLKSLRIGLHVPIAYGNNRQEKWQAWVVLESKVTKLKCDGFRRVKLIYPECIEHLEVDESDLPLTTKFASLKIVRVSFFRGLHPEAYKDVLNISDILEEFYLDSDYNEQLRLAANELLEQALKKNVKIYISDIRLTESLEELPSFAREKDANLRWPKVKIHCYHKLASHVRHTSTFDYEALISNLNDQRTTLIRNQVRLNEHQFPVDFFEKIRVHAISVSRIENEDLFVWFLRKSSGLVKINFMDGCMSQTILNQLPGACGRSLKTLNIYGSGSLDYEPLYELLGIFRISIEDVRNMELKIVPKLLQNCKHLIRLVCNDSRARLGVDKDGNRGKLYHLVYIPVENVNPLKMENLDMEELRKKLEEIIINRNVRNNPITRFLTQFVPF